MPSKEELQQQVEALQQQLAALERQRRMDFERGKTNSMYLEIFPSKYLKFPGRKKEWYVRLKAGNHETLNTSEGFATKWNAKRHAKKIFPNLEVKPLDE